MNIFRDPKDVSPSDVQQVCRDALSEGPQFEIKSDLPTRTSQLDGWHSGASFGDFARNQIAEEVVAFANTMGGVLLIGIEESSDHPHRAVKVCPLPRVQELARRLRQAVQDIVDPPLPLLEAEGIDMGGGSGVVILRVAASRRMPHRHQVNKEVFIRRADESVRIGMREIQELTIRAVAEVTRIDDLIEKRRARFHGDFSDWIRQSEPAGARYPGGGLHLIGVPTTSFDLGRVVGRSDLIPCSRPLRARFRTVISPCSWPAGSSLIWKPALRSIRAEHRGEKTFAAYSLHSDGICELSFFYGNTNYRQGLFANWLVAALAFMLNWIEIIRRAAENVGTEFALAPAIAILGVDAILAEYGVNSFAEAYGTRLEPGFYKLPIMSIGEADEFLTHIAQFDEDIWNLAGVDIGEGRPIFEFADA
jgi:hypothetical protein